MLCANELIKESNTLQRRIRCIECYQTMQEKRKQNSVTETGEKERRLKISNYKPEVNSSNVRKSRPAWSTWFDEVPRRQRHGTDAAHQRCVNVLHWSRHQHADAVRQIATPRPARQTQSIRYTVQYETICTQQLARSQLGLPHGNKQKIIK